MYSAEATPAVIDTSSDRLDLFAVESDGSLQHWWGDGDDWRVENLGGNASSAPAAVVMPDGSFEVFAITGAGATDGTAGRGSLQRWWRRDGQWQTANLGGVVSHAPAASTSAVYARGADGALQAWYRDDDSWEGPHDLGGYLASGPAVLEGEWSMRGTEVFAQGWFQMLSRWRTTASHPLEEFGGEVPPYLPRSLTRPSAVSIAAGRVDVFMMIPDEAAYMEIQGPLYKYAWSSGGMPMTDDLGGTMTLWPSAVSRGPYWLDVFGRSVDGTLLRWFWESPSVADDPMGVPWNWPSPHDLGGSLASAPAAVVRDRMTGWAQVDVFMRGTDGRLHHWRPDDWQAPLPEPRGSGTPQTEPEILVTRPADLLVLGAQYSGLRLVDDADGPAIEADDDTTIVISLPPQHIAEATFGSGLDNAAGDEVATLHATTRLSGNSWLACTLAPRTRIRATAQSLLEALSNGRLVAADNTRDDEDLRMRTVLEIPWRLRTSPTALPPAAGVACEHTNTPVQPETGVVGMWHTRLRPADAGTASSTAETLLALHPVDPGLAGATDPQDLSPPLARAGRTAVAQYGRTDPPLSTRVELSALGGSLQAERDWDAFAWKHDAVLGRDHKVEVQWKGVLYPFGHRAVYQEISERVFHPPDGQESVAALRKHRTLIVTEPVRTGPDDGELRRAFPFHQVEITQTITDLSDTDLPWHQYTRPQALTGMFKRKVRELQDLANWLAAEVMAAAPETGDRSPGALVEFWGDGMDSLATGMLENPDLAPQLAEWQGVKEKIGYIEDEAQSVSPHKIDVFFPADGLGLDLPVRCSGETGSIHFTIPMIFVADVRLAADSVTPQSFTSLADTDIGYNLARAYEGNGDVRLPGIPIKLVSEPDARRASDIPEVHGLHIEGVHIAESSDYRPRISRVEAKLPAIRALTDGDDLAQLQFTSSYLENGDSEDIALEIRAERDSDGRTQGLQIDFRNAADRVGGLAVPNFDADAISRRFGPVNQLGALSMKPEDMFTDAAALFGYSLKDLIRQAESLAPPTLVSGSASGGAGASLTWTAELDDHESFLATGDGPPATLEIVANLGQVDATAAVSAAAVVERAAAGVSAPAEISATAPEIRCTIKNFALSFPMLILEFDKVEFVQAGGSSPQVEIGAPTAKFGGDLQLLADLAKKLESLGFSDALPTIDVDGTGLTASYDLAIPSAAAGAFSLRNIGFFARLDVPFQPTTQRPISLSLAFASRENPFSLSVLLFGGGGYIIVEIADGEISSAEVSLEFGAMVAVDFAVASGEVHALGGVRGVLADGSLSLTGYIRFGGSVSVLGLVSVSVELTVGLTYRDGALLGRATLVLEIDVTLFSKKVELDSGVWRLAGGSSVERRDHPLTNRALDEAAFQNYRQHFIRRETTT